MKERSRLFTKLESFQSIHREQILIGEKLGEGGFREVHLCTLRNGFQGGQ